MQALRRNRVVQISCARRSITIMKLSPAQATAQGVWRNITSDGKRMKEVVRISGLLHVALALLANSGIVLVAAVPVGPTVAGETLVLPPLALEL